MGENTTTNQGTHSIGIVERETGIGRDTLRIWERRYGFPEPARNEKGERVYSDSQVRRLQRLRRLLDQGLRPGKVLPLGEDALHRLEASLFPQAAQQTDASIQTLVDAVRCADTGKVELLLQTQYQNQGMERFIVETVTPLLSAVGELWAGGRLQIFQEHFLSDQLIRFLNTQIAKLQKTGRVTVCFFGDGASNQGTFHEAINIAASFSLPVVYVCENNLFGVGTRQCPAVRKIENIADRAVGYGIPGVVVDGNDVLAVYGAASEAVERARAGEGPTLIECKTYRWRTHFEGEPDTYRDPAEVKEWLAKEPIGRFKAALVKQGVLTEDEAQAIEQRVIEELEEAVRFAYDSPEPAVAEALTDVYAG